MVRPKGGRSQPRYYYYKQAGENKLVKLLEENVEFNHKKISKADELCHRLMLCAKVIDRLLADIKNGKHK